MSLAEWAFTPEGSFVVVGSLLALGMLLLGIGRELRDYGREVDAMIEDELRR